jgi:hypothetical protein
VAVNAPAAMGLLAGIPAATLLGAYGWLALDHGTPAVFAVVVHENGRLTLAETIFYWRHALREVPLAGAYAVASLAAVAAYGPHRTRAPSLRWRATALGGAVLVVVVAWTATARTLGTGVAWQELHQTHLDDGAALQAGVHWRFHLLATVAYAAAAVVLAAGLCRGFDGGWRAPSRATRACATGALALVVLVPTGIWGLTAEPFADPRYLGHQAREVGTHLLVTLPLSFAALAAVGGWRAGPGAAGVQPRPVRDVTVAAVAAAVAVAYLGLGSVLADAARAARPGARLSSLVGAHYYEHALDYVLVTLLAIAFAPRTHPGGGRS